MNILFICSSAEEGRDGVGDYLSRVAQELIEDGHKITLIAANDRHISESSERVRFIGGSVLLVQRIPACYGNRKRSKLIKSWINRYQPDLISLQYVGFGFNNYGLPLQMVLMIKRLATNIAIQIMFHELWCGMAATAKVKERILGKLQKLFIKMMIAYLRPKSVFTNIKSYAVHLRNIKVRVQIAPIFGNIPVNNFGDIEDWNNIADVTGLQPLCDEPQKWLVFGFFGTVYPCKGLKAMIQLAVTAAIEIGLKPGILVIGHTRNNNFNLITQNIKGLTVWQTGHLPAPMVNRAMQKVDIGIITTPADGFYKSGTAVAWTERKIPVLISAEDESYNEIEMEPRGIHHATSTAAILNCFSSKNTFANTGGAKQIAQLYLERANG